jgi:RNA polymerase sigma factor (TIGR02999 family)
MPVQKEITNLLIDAGKGDRAASEKLVLRVYDELRSLAQRYLQRERPDHTLQPTALVHEAYMRLVDQDRAQWNDQAHFFRVAATMMRRILVDHARKHLAAKRGGKAHKMSLTQIVDLGIQKDSDLVAIDEALQEFADLDPQKCKIVELRFFAGLSMEKIARLLEVPLRTVERDWGMARIWLFRKLGAR